MDSVPVRPPLRGRGAWCRPLADGPVPHPCLVAWHL